MEIILLCVYSQTIREYLNENDGRKILKDHNTCGMLTDANRKSLITHLCEFLYMKFGPYPTSHQKKSVSLAAIQLFPSLKYTPSQEEGIVCSVNKLFYYIFSCVHRTSQFLLFFAGSSLRFEK